MDTEKTFLFEWGFITPAITAGNKMQSSYRDTFIFRHQQYDHHSTTATGVIGSFVVLQVWLDLGKKLLGKVQENTVVWPKMNKNLSYIPISFK